MPRLDVWLVENGHFSSRQFAKRAIKQGLVTVNSKKVKPSARVGPTDQVTVSSDAMDYPAGYFKLKKLDSLFSEIRFGKDTMVLDIGSSAGGFLYFLREREARAVGIEISEQFVDMLIPIIENNESLSLIVADAFDLSPLEIFERDQFDVLLIDVTTEVSGTLDLIASYSSVLKSGGVLIAAFKCPATRDNQKQLIEGIESIGFIDGRAIVLDQSTKEIHVVANRQ